ncbi:type II toxin-antitoxin system VapC family toxin [Pseudanabaena sp. UWO310]|uniref:type II toxin-antitoxin system VapC family toxin n=1 Tax=Pseudanabaena sp. UWO310 TaxID=2480795 RepID=UPI001158725D|nr:type II toxin-antitoxin system VapC family toxin [Pseudanabaena sp. UWO310]TYQ31509.1 type II toxin-antitoxin system VapC family toxin [Pseudanabaena sp. UWO310]
MSEIIVLDTHIWLWLINSDFERFPSSWLERFELAEILAVSPLSCYEVALAQSRGRLELTCSPEEWFSRALAPAKIELFPLTPEITVRAVNLSPIHKDPFDRLIIATALEHGAKLASIDSLFSKYPELESYLM